MRRIKNTSKKEIQIGLKTNHQDHAMTPVSLRTMKVMVSKPAKPIPPEEEEEETIFLDMMYNPYLRLVSYYMIHRNIELSSTKDSMVCMLRQTVM